MVLLEFEEDLGLVRLGVAARRCHGDVKLLLELVLDSTAFDTFSVEIGCCTAVAIFGGADA